MQTSILTIRPWLALVALFSLFAVGCAAGLGGARTSLKKNDLAGAEASLQKFLAENPDNAEAHMLMGDLRMRQGRSIEAGRSYDRALEAKTPALTAAQRSDIYKSRYDDWVRLYNLAIKHRNDSDPRGAILYLDTAIAVMPDASRTLWLQAVLAGDLKDNDLRQRSVDRYIASVQSDVNEGLKLGLQLGMSPQQVEAKLGTIPAADRKFDDDKGTIIVRPRRLALSFIKDDSGNMILDGWHFFKETDPEIAYQVPSSIFAQAYYVTAVAAYEAGEGDPKRYDEALRLLDIVSKLDPSNKETSRITSDIYVRTNRTAEARTAYEASIRENPNDAGLFVNYGNFLLTIQDYAGALKQYASAISVAQKGSEEYEKALFNSGATYRNWGAVILDSMRRAANGKPLTAKQTDLVNSKLREAVRYFEQLREAQGARVDFPLLSELVVLYAVIGDAGKQKSTLAALEARASAETSNCNYWRTMSQVYANLGDEKKYDSAKARADSICE